jgi:hypothetical protein
MSTYRFGQIPTSSEQGTLESILQSRVVEILREIPPPGTIQHITVEVEDENRRVCIGYTGNFIMFAIDPAGTVIYNCEIDRNCPEAPFPFRPYGEALRKMLQGYVLANETESKKRKALSRKATTRPRSGTRRLSLSKRTALPLL